MEVTVSENNDSIMLNKGITGSGWTIKVYAKNGMKMSDVINQIDEINKEMNIRFKNDKK